MSTCCYKYQQIRCSLTRYSLHSTFQNTPVTVSVERLHSFPTAKPSMGALFTLKNSQTGMSAVNTLQSLLNKVTAKNFDKILKQMREIQGKVPDHTIAALFRVAFREPMFGRLYVDLYMGLKNSQPAMNAVKTIQSLLKKVTRKKFYRTLEQIREIEMEIPEEVVTAIFRNATRDTSLAPLYTNLYLALQFPTYKPDCGGHSTHPHVYY